MPVLTTATILVLQIQNQKISTQVRTSVHGVSASHECAARRCTHWHHVIVVKHHTTVCQGVNVGRRHLVRPMETDVVPTLQQHQVYPSKIPHKQTYMSVSWTAFKLTKFSWLNPRTHLLKTAFRDYHHYRNNNNNNNNITILIVIIQRMWNVKTKVILFLTGATGTISKLFTKYLSNIPGNYELRELQKTSILGTAHTIQKVLRVIKCTKFTTGGIAFHVL